MPSRQIHQIVTYVAVWPFHFLRIKMTSELHLTKAAFTLRKCASASLGFSEVEPHYHQSQTSSFAYFHDGGRWVHGITTMYEYSRDIECTTIATSTYRMGRGTKSIKKSSNASIQTWQIQINVTCTWKMSLQLVSHTQFVAEWKLCLDKIL